MFIIRCRNIALNFPDNNDRNKHQRAKQQEEKCLGKSSY